VAACDPARRGDLPVGSSPPSRPQPRPFFPVTPPPCASLTTPEGPVQGVPSPAARRRHARHGLAHPAPAGVGTSLDGRVAARPAGRAASRHQAVAAPAAAASQRGRGAVVAKVADAGIATAVAPPTPCTDEVVAPPVAGAATAVAAAAGIRDAAASAGEFVCSTPTPSPPAPTRRHAAATTVAAACCSGGGDI